MDWKRFSERSSKLTRVHHQWKKVYAESCKESNLKAFALLAQSLLHIFDQFVKSNALISTFDSMLYGKLSVINSTRFSINFFHNLQFIWTYTWGFMQAAIGMGLKRFCETAIFDSFCVIKKKLSACVISIFSYFLMLLIAGCVVRFVSFVCRRKLFSRRHHRHISPAHSICTWFLRFLLLKQVGFVVMPNSNSRNACFIDVDFVELLQKSKSIGSHHRIRIIFYWDFIDILQIAESKCNLLFLSHVFRPGNWTFWTMHLVWNLLYPTESLTCKQDKAAKRNERLTFSPRILLNNFLLSSVSCHECVSCISRQMYHWRYPQNIS